MLEKPIVISHRNEIDTLPSELKQVHFSFRPSMKDIMKLLEVCPNLNNVQFPPFVRGSISETVEDVFKMKKITLSEGMIYEREDKNRFYN